MFRQVRETTINRVRWVLVIGWLILISSLFYDPITPLLTNPEATWSPFHLTDQCVPMGDTPCMAESSYSLGPSIFWGAIVPSTIFILLVFGHETWRRICPLSFLSQLPGALKLQRQRQVKKNQLGARQWELVTISKDSWLGRNRLYLQFGLLFLGLCCRLLFLDSNPIALGSFLIATIAIAISIGYLFAGKSWCHYFCPMAPVQLVFTGPRGFLGSEAHHVRGPITQSMCRTTTDEGMEKRACVVCCSPCFDIDAERTHWDMLTQPVRKLVQYGYVGLVLGFFSYYFLYSGDWLYYYSGAANHDDLQLQAIFAPGLYLCGQVLPIPKVLAVPSVLAVFSGLSYFLGLYLEKLYRRYRHQWGMPIDASQATHHLFAMAAFVVFNLFFIFGGRPLLSKLPSTFELLFNAFIAVISTLWLYRTLGRSAEDYSRERLAGSLRRQLAKLNLDLSPLLENRSLDDLKPDEVYVLAKVIPEVNKVQGLTIYKGVLQETLETRSASSADSLTMLAQIRHGLGVSDEGHFTILNELGVEFPELLDPELRRNQETHLRLNHYRQFLDQLVLDAVDGGLSILQVFDRKSAQLQTVKRQYGITVEEETQICSTLTPRIDTNPL